MTSVIVDEEIILGQCPKPSDHEKIYLITQTLSKWNTGAEPEKVIAEIQRLMFDAV